MVLVLEPTEIDYFLRAALRPAHGGGGGGGGGGRAVQQGSDEPPLFVT